VQGLKPVGFLIFLLHLTAVFISILVCHVGMEVVYAQHDPLHMLLSAVKTLFVQEIDNSVARFYLSDEVREFIFHASDKGASEAGLSLAEAVGFFSSNYIKLVPLMPVISLLLDDYAQGNREKKLLVLWPVLLGLGSLFISLEYLLVIIPIRYSFEDMHKLETNKQSGAIPKPAEGDDGFWGTSNRRIRRIFACCGLCQTQEADYAPCPTGDVEMEARSTAVESQALGGQQTGHRQPAGIQNAFQNAAYVPSAEARQGGNPEEQGVGERQTSVPNLTAFGSVPL